MVPKKKIDEILDEYSDFRIATICSHSSLQIFKGAREEGIKTIGIVKKENKKTYESFPYGKPDEFIVVDDYKNIPSEEIVSKNAIMIPHGSFVEYVGEKFDSFEVPVYGNRQSLVWERSREKMISWLHKSGIKTPHILTRDEIDGPCLVKFPGAKGGRGYFIVKSRKEFDELVGEQECMIQEFIIGVRAYPHYFFSPFSNAGYEVEGGRIELLGFDTRIESSADEIARAVSAGIKRKMAFTVIGNEPMVLRESLLTPYLEMGKKALEASRRLFGGIFGPYCIETIIDEHLNIHAFEISARIVAGTNIYPDGSPYSTYYYKEPMSTGRRIAVDLKEAFKRKRMNEIIY